MIDLTLSYVQKTMSCSGPPVSVSSAASPSESESSRSELISSDARSEGIIRAETEPASPAPGGGVEDDADDVEEGPSSCGTRATPSCGAFPLLAPSASQGGGPPARRCCGCWNCRTDSFATGCPGCCCEWE